MSDCLKSLPCKIHYNQLLSTNGLRPHRITPWLLDLHHSFNDTQPHSIIVKYQQSVSEDTKIWTRGGHDLVLPSHQIKNKETPAVVTYKDRPASDHKAALFNEFFSSGHYTVLVKWFSHWRSYWWLGALRSPAENVFYSGLSGRHFG